MWNLFACMALPLLLSLGLLDQRGRTIIGSLVSGMFMCMFVGVVNSLIRSAMASETLFYITTTFTPITEEIVKAIPVFLYAYAISNKKEKIVPVAMAVGIGFAILENAYILVSELGNWSPFSSLIRVFGASLMHGICTSLVGIGMSCIFRRKKLFFTGTFALLILAMIYHGIFNALIQSSFRYIGMILPIATFLPIGISIRKKRKKTVQKTDEK